jgi:hypothetical protein
MPNRGRFMEWTARIAARYRGADAATTNVEGAHQRPGSAADACRSCFALPCLRDVRRVRGRGRCDPHRLRSRRYRPRRYRPPSSCAAPAVPRGGGQRTGAGMRPDHRRLEAAICAATAGQAGPRQVALADAMTANGSAPVEHDEEHGAGLGADAAWLGGPGACPRVSGAEAAARRPGHRQLRGLQSLGVRRRPCPFLADRVCLGPGHWTGGAGHAKPGDSRHLLRFGQA